MKKICLLLAVLMLTLFSAMNCYAYTNEPSGFRDMQWGDSVDLFLMKHKDEVVGYPSHDAMKDAFQFNLLFKANTPEQLSQFKHYMIQSNKPISGENNFNIIYSFQNGKLVGVYMIKVDLADPKKFMNSMKSMYGKPAREEVIAKGNNTVTGWFGEKTYLFVTSSNQKDSFILIGMSSSKAMDDAQSPANQGW